MAKKPEAAPAKPVLGRVKNHLKMGIVGMPNVGTHGNVLNSYCALFPLCFFVVLCDFV